VLWIQMNKRNSLKKANFHPAAHFSLQIFRQIQPPRSVYLQSIRKKSLIHLSDYVSESISHLWPSAQIMCQKKFCRAKKKSEAEKELPAENKYSQDAANNVGHCSTSMFLLVTRRKQQ